MSSGTVLFTIHWNLIRSGYSRIEGRNTNSHTLLLSVEREAITPHTQPCLKIIAGFTKLQSPSVSTALLHCPWFELFHHTAQQNLTECLFKH